MLDSKAFSYRFGLSVTAAVVLGAAVLGGCSSSGGGEDYSAPMPSGPTKVAKKPAVGPAITEKLSFDQIALDSPTKKISKNGVPYLVFKYTDVQGNVRTCELPEAKSQADMLPGDWISTFDTYKKDEAVVVKKREVKRTDQGVVDFPFISPKPVRVESSKTENRSSGRVTSPIPDRNSIPVNSSPSPGGMPSP